MQDRAQAHKLRQVLAAVIDKLSRTDYKTAMVAIGTLLDEAAGALPPDERERLRSEFADLANGS
jgi:hypothetical protein